VGKEDDGHKEGSAIYGECHTGLNVERAKTRRRKRIYAGALSRRVNPSLGAARRVFDG
jgi:hypothetical protein